MNWLNHFTNMFYGVQCQLKVKSSQNSEKNWNFLKVWGWGGERELSPQFGNFDF